MTTTKIRRAKEVKIVYDVDIGDDFIKDGRISGDEAGRKIAAMILASFRKAKYKEDVILNLKGCKYISAEALRPIFLVAKKISAKNHAVVLMNASADLLRHIKDMDSSMYFKVLKGWTKVVVDL
jgi:hypothetical protein